MKKSVAQTVREPRPLRSVKTASSASITAGSSAAGSACARLPPSVPRVRIAACAMNGIAAATSGASPATISLRSSDRCRAMAPTRRNPSPDVTFDSPAISFRSTRTAGVASRKFIAGIRL